MKLKINGEEIELIYSFRSAVYFEQIAGHNLDFTKMSQNDLITLFYCVVIASLQKAKKPVITMLEFMDVIDDNLGEKCIVEFSNWYVQTITAQYEIINSMEDDQKKPAKRSKKKTN